MKKILFCALVLFAIPAAAQNPPRMTPAQVRAKIYQQCMATSDRNFAVQQKAYCECTSDNISRQVNAEDMASIAATAGQGASQTDIGNALMSDPRLIQIVSHCFSTALGQSGNGAVGTPEALPSTTSGLIGKPFSQGGQ